MHPANSASSSSQPDPLFVSIDGLVRDGTLSPDQATRVYNSVRASGAVSADGSGSPARASRPGRLVVASATLLLGGGLVLSGGVVADILAMGRRDFSWKSFVVVLGATLALLAAAAAVRLLIRAIDHRDGIAAGLAALGAVGAGLCANAAFSDHGGAGYVAGLLILAISVGGYVWLRGSALAASAVLGGLVLLDTALGDAPDSLGSGIGACVVLVLYGVAVAAAGWVLPCRHVTGVLGGVVALYGVFVGILSGGITSLVFLGQAGPSDSSGEVAVAMAIGLLVIAALFGLYAVTGHAGYPILGVVGAVLVPTAALFSFASGNALRWGAVIAAVGFAMMAGSGFLARTSARSQA